MTSSGTYVALPEMCATRVSFPRNKGRGENRGPDFASKVSILNGKIIGNIPIQNKMRAESVP